MRIDWIVDRRGDAGPMINQGNRPTCLSCATSSAHCEMSGDPKSIEFLHYTSRSKPTGVGAFESIHNVLANEGQPPETQWPYDPAIENSLAVPPPHIAGPFANAKFTISSDVDPNHLTTELEGGELPVIGLVTTRRFMVLKDAILTEPDAHLNRHAVLLVGAASYAGPDVSGLVDGDILMCVQNSWGPTWGGKHSGPSWA